MENIEIVLRNELDVLSVLKSLNKIKHKKIYDIHAVYYNDHHAPSEFCYFRPEIYIEKVVFTKKEGDSSTAELAVYFEFEFEKEEYLEKIRLITESILSLADETYKELEGYSEVCEDPFFDYEVEPKKASLKTAFNKLLFVD